MKLTCKKGLITSLLLGIVSLYGTELVWFPVPTDEPSQQAQVDAVFQVGSEVWIMYIIGDLVAPTAIGSTAPLEVDFPTLFVTNAFDQWDLEQYKTYLTSVIFGDVEGVPMANGYDYATGNGIIQHPVFGELNIANYPWVYSRFFGWRFVKEAGARFYSNGWWFWEPDIGWYWTTRNFYPLIYNKDGIRLYPMG